MDTGNKERPGETKLKIAINLDRLLLLLLLEIKVKKNMFRVLKTQE